MVLSVAAKVGGAVLVVMTWVISTIDEISDGVKLLLVVAGLTLGYGAIRLEGRARGQRSR
jgi:hypothetical protein